MFGHIYERLSLAAANILNKASVFVYVSVLRRESHKNLCKNICTYKPHTGSPTVSANTSPFTECPANLNQHTYQLTHASDSKSLLPIMR